MYAFLVLALPLGFLLLVLGVFPAGERSATKRPFLRGVLASIPLVLVARLLGAIVPTAPGSALGFFHELADRILPYAALPALLYRVFYRYGERLPPGAAERRLTAFYAGALAPMGLYETLRLWGRADPYELLLLPVVLAALVLSMPRLAFGFRDGYGFRMVLLTLGAAAAGVALAFIPFLFILRFWPLAWLLVAGAGWLAWFLSYPELARRPPPPTE